MKNTIIAIIATMLLPQAITFGQQPPPPPPPPTCLEKCKYDRMILDDVYKYCMNEAIEKFRAKYQQCLSLPPGEQQACISSGVKKLRKETKQCKAEYDGDFRALLGCEARCAMDDLGPTRR